MRILLVDNHVVIRSGLRALLQTYGQFHVCGEANNGHAAIDLAIRKKPDVVVIDIDLPDINGIEATRRIRKERPDAEVLIFSTENNEELIRQALAAGAREYLLKSAPDEQIIQAIETIGKHRSFCSSTISEILFNDLSRQISGISQRGRLTDRERQTLRLIAAGHRTKGIAQVLGISPKTVSTHRAAAMRKLHLQSTADIVRYAMRENLV